VLGEDNYCNFKAQYSEGIVLSAEPRFNASKPFEKEFARARKLADRCLLLIDELYVNLRRGVNTDFSPLLDLFGDVVSSQSVNPYVWIYICQAKNKDSYLVEHAFRTAVLSMCLGRGEDLGDMSLEELGLSAVLSDVGKIMIPESILSKEGALSSAEYAVIQVHPLEGRKILSAYTQVNENILAVVMSHHEHVDGNGYPAGIKGDDISVAARIVAIADAFDAMTSQRSYAAARSIYETYAILWACRGKQFDSELVERFLAMLGELPPGSTLHLDTGERVTILEPTNDRDMLSTLIETSSEPARLKLVSKRGGNDDSVYIKGVKPVIEDAASFIAQRSVLLGIS